MPIDKHYPLHDVIFNLQTYCTREEAVGIMLGMMNGPPALIDRYGCFDHNTQEEIEKLEYSLQDDLEDRRDTLVNDYNEARIKGLSEEDVAERFAAIKEFDTNYVNKARTYLCHIDDELTKGAKSELRLYQGTTEGGPVRITLKSLDEWAGKKPFEIAIFKNLDSNTVSANHAEESESDVKGRMSKTAANSLYTSFAFLVQAFVEEKGGRFGTPDNINVINVAEYLSEFADKAKSKGLGQGTQSIKKRIDEAMHKKKGFLEN